MYWDDIYDDFLASEEITGLPEGERSVATATIPAPQPTTSNVMMHPTVYTAHIYSSPDWLNFSDPATVAGVLSQEVEEFTGQIFQEGDAPWLERQELGISPTPTRTTLDLPIETIIAGTVGGRAGGVLLMGTMLGTGVRGVAGPIIKNLWGAGLKGLSKVPGTTTLKQGVASVIGVVGIGMLVDTVFDGDEEMLDRMLGFIEQGIQEGSILWPTFRRGDNSGEQIPPNYLTFDLNKGTGWIHQEHISKNFVNAVRRNERTPRYKSTPSPKRRR